MSTKSFIMSTLTILSFGSIVLSSPTLSKTTDGRLHVAVIDTGLSLHDPRFQDVLCSEGHKDFTGEGMYDANGHGTHVAGIIMRNAPDHTKYCLVIYKVFGEHGEHRSTRALAAVNVNHIPLVNYSVSGDAPDEMERSLMALSSATFTVAAGNKGAYYKSYYPGGYDLANVHVVGNWDCNHNKAAPSSNYGEGVNWRCGTDIVSTLPRGRWGIMSGTSMAAPLYMAELINRMTK